MRKLFKFSLLLAVLWCESCYAFLEDSPEKIERSIKTLAASARQGITSANRKLHEELELYQELDLTRHEIDDMLRKMKRYRLPDYVLDRGSLTYSQGNNYIYVTGRNVGFYSMPMKEAQVMITRLNAGYMIYMGEWKPQSQTQKAISWVFARGLDSNKAGWIERSSVQFIANSRLAAILADIKEGIAGYNLTTMRRAQKDSQSVNRDSLNYSTFTQDMSRQLTSTLRSARSGSMKARRELEAFQKTLTGILTKKDLSPKSWSENDEYVQKLIHEGRLNASSLRAGYKYDEAGLVIYTPDKAAIRSEPDSESQGITTTKAGQALRYLGERMTRSGVKFYLADDLKGNTGWISERVSEVIPVEAVQAMNAEIQEWTRSGVSIRESFGQ